MGVFDNVTPGLNGSDCHSACRSHSVALVRAPLMLEKVSGPKMPCCKANHQEVGRHHTKRESEDHPGFENKDIHHKKPRTRVLVTAQKEHR